MESDRDLLVRIDERVKSLTERLPALEKRVNELEDFKTKMVGYACGAVAVVSVLTEVVKAVWK